MEENTLTSKSYSELYRLLKIDVTTLDVGLIAQTLIYFENDITKIEDYLTIFEHLHSKWMTDKERSYLQDSDLFCSIIETRAKRLGLIFDENTLQELYERTVLNGKRT